MRKRQRAITVAVVGAFALALVGWCSGLAPHTCAIRAGVGMVALYLMVRVAGRIIAGIIADAIVRSASDQAAARKASRGRET